MASARWIRGSLLGEGSFGKVNLAISTNSGELFAVKSVKCSDQGSVEVLSIENELSILQSLDSHRIVKCLGSDFTVENGAPMRNLFMEYMAGGSLTELMDKFGGSLSEAVVRSYAHSILEGLDYLHREGIVHCDIKGRNILVGAAGDVKIADFGSAKRGAAPGMQLKGTPLWMAPEVILQQEQGPASDIWSLGCTIVELLSGRPPWNLNGANPFQALLQIAHGRTERLSLPECISTECTDFISKCLHTNPQTRWSSGQLLQHPFVKIAKQEARNTREEESHKAPMSPTSVCDFPMVTDNWDVANPSPVFQQPRITGIQSEKSKAAHWLTVRGSQNSARQMALSSFMVRAEAGHIGAESGSMVKLEEERNDVSRRRSVRKGKMPSLEVDGAVVAADVDMGCVEKFVSAARAHLRAVDETGDT